MRSASKLSINLIDAADRLRPSDPAWVQAIAASMAEHGQEQPIIVRRSGDRFVLVAGKHRLDGAQLLGWTAIDADVRHDMTDEQARIVEIDENLMRQELSAIDRAIFLAKRKAIWEALYPETAIRGRRKELRTTCPQFLPSTFAKDVAERTGLSDRTIRRSTELASLLSPEIIAAIRGTKLADNAAALKKLSLLPADRRLKVAQTLGAGEAKSINAALGVLGLAEPAVTDERLQRSAKFMDLLSRSDPAARRDMILTIFRQATSGQLPALANALAEGLSTKGKKLVIEALGATATSSEEAA